MELKKMFSRPCSRDFNYLLLLMLVVLFVPVFFMPMINAPDTGSYLTLTSQRPPLFSLLLRFDHWVTGGHFLLTRLVQVGLMIAALLLLDKWLRRTMEVSRYAIFILCFLFLVPLIYHGHFGRLLLSEALSIPLYVFMLVYLCELFSKPCLTIALSFSLCVGLLILTRNQFYFLYGFFPLAILWYCILRLGAKKIALISSVFVLCVGVTSLFSLGYHRILHGKFANTSANGPLLLVQPLFLAKASDVQYFKTQKEKAAFLAVYKHAEQQGFLQVSNAVSHPGFNLGWDNLPRYVHFVDTFDPLQFDSARVLGSFYPTMYATDNFMKHMAAVLFLHNLKENLSFYSWKFSYSMGGPLLLVVFILLALVALIASLRNRESVVAITTLVLLCLVFANNLTIAVSEMVLSRYLIYPSFALLVLMLILFSKALAHKEMNKVFV